jgi:hypothetical protein
MMHIHLGIDNPFHKNSDTLQKDYFCKTWSLSTNRTLEIQISRWSKTVNSLVDFELDLRWRGQDHAGPRIEIGLFNHSVIIYLMDNRHWNWKTNDWEKYHGESNESKTNSSHN